MALNDNWSNHLNEIFANLRRHRMWIYLLLAFTAGCLCTGLLLFGQRSTAVGRLNQRYAEQYAGAAGIIGQLEEELARERDYNNRLREHNNYARGLIEGIAGSAQRNVRNLSDVVGLISEIRTKIKILEDFYTGGDTGSSDP